jgi:hypothetical protein
MRGQQQAANHSLLTTHSLLPAASGRVRPEIADFPLSFSDGNEAHFKRRADGKFQTE